MLTLTTLPLANPPGEKVHAHPHRPRAVLVPGDGEPVVHEGGGEGPRPAARLLRPPAQHLRHQTLPRQLEVCAQGTPTVEIIDANNQLR